MFEVLRTCYADYAPMVGLLSMSEVMGLHMYIAQVNLKGRHGMV